MKATPQIFLSYARWDEKRVKKLYKKLANEGFKPWMDKKVLLAGEKWKPAIHQAIRNSDFFLACLSEDSAIKRGFLQNEIKEALDNWREKLVSDIHLISVRMEDCDVPDSLGELQWVDLFENDGWMLLAKAIREGTKRRVETKFSI